MSFYSQGLNLINRWKNGSKSMPAKEPDALPAVLCERDLLPLIVLIVVIVPDMRGMEFAGTTVFFYWFLAFFTFLLPLICVFRWLLRQAPRHVPLYIWILRLVRERWRSVLVFLLWWTGVLSVLSILGMCLSLLQSFSPSWFSAFPVRCLAFTGLLIAATLLTALPLRLFRLVLWGCGVLYLAFFVLLGVSMLVVLNTHPSGTPMFSHQVTGGIPEPFSWSLFGLAILSLVGLSSPLLLDGEFRGPHRFLRGSSASLWWGGLGSFLLSLLCTIAWLLLKHETQGFLFEAVGPVLGSHAQLLAWLLLFLGSFGCTLAYLFVFSRAFLLAARQGYLPRFLARLNPAGTPLRALLVESALVACAALVLLVMIPALLRAALPVALVQIVTTGDQFSLLASIGISLWCALLVLLFVFALWLFWKKDRRFPRSWGQRLVFSGLCLSGCLSSLVCAFSPLLPDWPSLFFSHNRWFPLVLLGLVCSLVLAWIISELPRRAALLHAKEQSLAREKALREELQQVNLQQKLLLNEINRLYREQEEAAKRDPVTGLLNHGAFLQCLEEEIARNQADVGSFLLVFLDLDHFKQINDTWGHLAGDAVLCEVASRLRKDLRPGDSVGRYGGEEFALIRAGASMEQAEEQGERLRQAIEAAPCSWQNEGETTTRITISASIGVACYGMHGVQSTVLLTMADQAMYQAKREGRNRVRIAGAHLPGTQSSILAPSSGREPEPERETLVSVQALQGLVAMIQARDATASAHASRVIRAAGQTGHRLHASPEDLFLIRLGGLFHDIGKVGIPDVIVNKAGSLNEEEWEIMRQHPVIGAQILERMGGIFQHLAPIVRAHHERWDGSGYPQGLSGTEIPLAARVLSVADAYDAMISRRPYKEPMPASAAQAELRRNAGTQFDPAVVQAFLSLLETQALGQNDPEEVEDWRAFMRTT